MSEAKTNPARLPAYPPPGSPLGADPYVSQSTSKYVARPRLWGLFQAYCAGMTLMYSFSGIASLSMIVFANDLVRDNPSASPEAVIFAGALGLLMSIALMGFFGSAPFLPRQRWAWIYCVAVIGIGLGSPCLLPASLPLLLSWLKDETRHFYGIQKG